MPRKYPQISYTIDDEEEQASQDNFEFEDKKKSTRESTGEENGNHILTTRTRGAGKQQVNKQVEETLRKGQDKLLTVKLEELKKRYANDEIQMNSKKQKQKDMGKIQSYSSVKRFPTDLRRGLVYVDEKNDTILLPINSEQFVPFHVSTINTVSKSD